jgi:hypothetical protein
MTDKVVAHGNARSSCSTSSTRRTEQPGGNFGRHIGDFRRGKEHDGYRRALERLLRELKVEPTT